MHFDSPLWKVVFNLTCIVILFIIHIGAYINYYEKTEKIDGDILAVVGSVQENYIALIYNDNKKGVEQEIGFSKNPDIRLIHKRRWDDIKTGEEVIAHYVETRRVREGKTDKGDNRIEATVLDRKLVSLEFDEVENSRLISGE